MVCWFGDFRVLSMDLCSLVFSIFCVVCVFLVFCTYLASFLFLVLCCCWFCCLVFNVWLCNTRVLLGVCSVLAVLIWLVFGFW